MDAAGFHSFCSCVGSTGARGANSRILDGSRACAGTGLGNMFGARRGGALFAKLSCMFRNLRPARADGVLGGRCRDICALTTCMRSRMGLLSTVDVITNVQCTCGRGFGDRFAPGLSLVCRCSKLGMHTSCTTKFHSPALRRVCTISRDHKRVAIKSPSLSPRGDGFCGLGVRCGRHLFSVTTSVCRGSLGSGVRTRSVKAAPRSVRGNVAHEHRCHGVRGTHIGNFSVNFSIHPFANFVFKTGCVCASKHGHARSVHLREAMHRSNGFGTD